MALSYKQKTAALLFGTLLLLPFFIVGVSSFGVSVVYGQLPPGVSGLFGGRLNGYIQCTCTVGHVMYIGPPRSAAVHLVPSSTVYPYGQVKGIGQWQLGIYGSPSPCRFFNGWHCVTIPHQGDVIMIGTSGVIEPNTPILGDGGTGEVCAGDVDCPFDDGGDFDFDPECPEYGDLGIWHIIGKGDKDRHLPILTDWIHPVLDQYLEGVRPHWLGNPKTPEEDLDALFFSNEGKRLSTTSIQRIIERRFKQAGVKKKFSPLGLSSTVPVIITMTPATHRKFLESIALAAR